VAAVPERCTACNTPIPEGTTRCPACGKVYGDDAPDVAGTGPSNVVVRRGASAGLRTLGALSIGAGVLAAALAVMIIPGAAGFVLAFLLGGAGVGLGALGLRAGAKQSQVADRHERAAHERAILDLAEKSDGDLTATETARALGVTIEEADARLTAMADGARVSVELDPDGIVHYVFRELAVVSPRAAARVRAPAQEAEPVEEPIASSEARSRSENEG